MKKLLTLVLCAVTFAVSAGNDSGLLAGKGTTPAQATTPTTTTPASAEKTQTEAPVSASAHRLPGHGQKGYKFKDRPVMYILCGVLIVVIVVVTVATGGQGYNSRQ